MRKTLTKIFLNQTNGFFSFLKNEKMDRTYVSFQKGKQNLVSTKERYIQERPMVNLRWLNCVLSVHANVSNCVHTLLRYPYLLSLIMLENAITVRALNDFHLCSLNHSYSITNPKTPEIMTGFYKIIPKYC